MLDGLPEEESEILQWMRRIDQWQILQPRRWEGKRGKYFCWFHVLIEGVLRVLPGGTQEENTKKLQRVQRSYQWQILQPRRWEGKREKYFCCFHVLIGGVLCVLPGGTQEDTKDLQQVQNSYQRHLLHL